MRPKLVIAIVLSLASLAAISTYLVMSDQPEEVAKAPSYDTEMCVQPSSFQTDAAVNISSMTSSPEKEPAAETPSTNSTAGPDSTPKRTEEVQGQLRYADLCVGMVVCEHHPGGLLQEGVVLDTDVPNQTSYPLDYPLVMIRFQMASGPLELRAYTVGWGFEPWPNGVWNGSWFTRGRCDGSQSSSARSV